MAESLRPPDVRYPRSPSRRRRSSTSDHEPASSKFRRTGHHADISPYRAEHSGDLVARRRSLALNRLCDQCRHIDLAYIISSQKHIPSSRGHFIMYLDLDERSTCPLCMFLRKMRIPLPANANTNDGTRQHGYHLRAFSGMSSYREYFFRPPSGRRPHSGDTMLAVVPNGLFSDEKGRDQYPDTLGKVGYILPVAHSSTAPWLTGRRINACRVDFPLLQGWLQFCRKNHGCAMRYSRPDKLRLIDCKEMKMVVAPPNCNYFALSYVWGPPTTSPTASAMRVPDRAPPNPLSNLAPVVQDAISVVKGLGWRYLWVDKYCIPQNDESLKHEQLRVMDLIYEGAYCTIVAAAGSNDRHGLPGISRPRQEQPSFDDGHDQWVSSESDPQKEIRESKWMTRAWTYQEAVCSARRLIFTPKQVYFECKSMHCCEAVEVPLNLLHTRDRKAIQTWVRQGLFKDEWLQGTHRFGPLSTFWNVIKQYSSRDMTKKCDVLHGTSGILRRFQASPSFVHNILGIPLYCDPKDAKEALLNPQLFIAGLSFTHVEPPRRRICPPTCDCFRLGESAKLPSWTWAGWNGTINLQHTFASAAYETNVKLWVEEVDGQRTPWTQFWNGFWTPEGKITSLEKFRFVIVEADVFKVQLVPSISKSNELQKDCHKEQARVDMVNPYTKDKLASILLPEDLSGSPKVKNDLWDCFILGKKAKSGAFDVMLVRWTIDVTERVWAGTLLSPRHQHKVKDRDLPPTLRKKFILK